ncbi:MAG: hypothetical protein QM658_06200, partial [Gordonia sp. (in: high G+C Gram-positive bacteria)]
PTTSVPHAAYAPTQMAKPQASNPQIVPPQLSNPQISNPQISNPQISNPQISNPHISNPHIANRQMSNPQIAAVQAPMYPPPGYPQPVVIERGSGRVNMALMGVLVVIVLVLLALGGWMLADKMRGADNDGSVADRALVTTDAQGQTTTVTTGVPAPTTSTYTPGPPPSDNQPCPGYTGLGTGYPQWTGCEFANNVRSSYLAGGPNGEARVVNGWAPQMQKNFVMDCQPYQGIIACRGGNQAVVYIY